mmetsp:Transcript_48330/g.134996  ORF Transcript_48330/g.134996 Transcript_48330/m.134996 type:complete len:200 (+) Transcript_48330:105-704(+)
MVRPRGGFKTSPQFFGEGKCLTTTVPPPVLPAKPPPAHPSEWWHCTGNGLWAEAGTAMVLFGGGGDKLRSLRWREGTRRGEKTIFGAAACTGNGGVGMALSCGVAAPRGKLCALWARTVGKGGALTNKCCGGRAATGSVGKRIDAPPAIAASCGGRECERASICECGSVLGVLEASTCGACECVRSRCGENGASLHRAC